jgi:hypothetical protein
VIQFPVDSSDLFSASYSKVSRSENESHQGCKMIRPINETSISSDHWSGLFVSFARRCMWLVCVGCNLKRKKGLLLSVLWRQFVEHVGGQTFFGHDLRTLGLYLS